MECLSYEITILLLSHLPVWHWKGYTKGKACTIALIFISAACTSYHEALKKAHMTGSASQDMLHITKKSGRVLPHFYKFITIVSIWPLIFITLL